MPKKPKKKRGIFSKILLVFLGLILLLIALFVKDVIKNSLKIHSDMTQVQEVELTEDGFYQSQYGWQMKVPPAWGKTKNEVVKMEKFEPSDKKFGESGWTYVAVEPFIRVEAVDSGQFLAEYKKIFLSEEFGKQFPKLEFISEPQTIKGKNAIVYEFIFEHDFYLPDTKEVSRMKQIRRYIYPPEKGDGWLLYSQAQPDDWTTLEPEIKDVMNSFGGIPK